MVFAEVKKNYYEENYGTIDVHLFTRQHYPSSFNDLLERDIRHFVGVLNNLIGEKDAGVEKAEIFLKHIEEVLCRAKRDAKKSCQ